MEHAKKTLGASNMMSNRNAK